MLPIILGIAGHSLSQEERDLFRAFPPYGFILFKRNVDTPEQVKALTASLRELAGRDDTPILIDQEGGRVQRLRPPHWVDLPDLRTIGDLYKKDAGLAINASFLQGQIIAGILYELGINVVCAPVLDVPVKGAHDVIGNRAFSTDAYIVDALGKPMTEDLRNCGVMPVLKHIPGHGRAEADSHYACPVVKEPLEVLQQTDFYPFKMVAEEVGADLVWAMTAHVIFTALDDKPVSVSKKSIDFLRKELGIIGPIIPDAIEMEALGGTLVDRALATLEAGCDATLHCSGKFDDMRMILEKLPEMTVESIQRFEKAQKVVGTPATTHWRDLYIELQELLTIRTAGDYEAHEALTRA